MRRLVLLTVVVLAIVTGLPVAQSAGGPALDANRLSRLDRVLQQYVDENRIGGAVALVLQDGHPVDGTLAHQSVVQ